MPGGFLPHSAWRPSTNHKALLGESPCSPTKSGNPIPPPNGNLPFYGCQKTCFPKAQNGPALLILLDHISSPSKSKNTRFPTNGKITVTYYSVSGIRSLPLKVCRGLALSTVPDYKRAPAPPLKRENAMFLTEERKAITCYSAGSTRRPASPRSTEAQRFTLYLPAGECCLSCPRTGIPAPPWSGNPLH
jgi:hypothetical protein